MKNQFLHYLKPNSYANEWVYLDCFNVGDLLFQLQKLQFGDQQTSGTYVCTPRACPSFLNFISSSPLLEFKLIS